MFCSSRSSIEDHKIGIDKVEKGSKEDIIEK